MKIEFKPFDECLSNLTRKQLIELLKKDFNNIDDATDDFLLKIAKPYVFLKYMQKLKEIPLYKQHTVAVKLYSKNYNEVHEEFYNDGLIFKNNDTYYVPTEYEHYLLEELESTIKCYVLYYIDINGVLEKTKLFSLLKETGFEGNDDYFESLINDNIQRDDKYFYLDKMYFEGIDIENFVKEKNKYNYKIIKSDDIYTDVKNILEKTKFNELNKFFNSIRNKTVVDNIKNHLMLMLFLNLNIKENVLKILKKYNVTLKDVNKLCKYIENNIANDFPIWTLNGYTTNEYEEINGSNEEDV